MMENTQEQGGNLMLMSHSISRILEVILIVENIIENLSNPEKYRIVLFNTLE